MKLHRDGFDFMFFGETGFTGFWGFSVACGESSFGWRPLYPDNPVYPVQLHFYLN
jgi:hypothetical protein